MLAALLCLGYSGASVSAGKAKKDQVIELIEFKDITVGNALRILSEQSHLNVVASEEAANIYVTMFLRKVTALEVIDAISKTYNLWYQVDSKSDIVRIYTVREYRLEKVDFKKEETEIFTMKNAKNALDLAETIENLFGRERVNLSFGENPQALLRDLNNRFELFDMVDSRTTVIDNNNRGGRGGRGRGGRGRGGFGSGAGGFGRNRSGFTGGNKINVGADEYLSTTEDVLDRMDDKSAGTGVSNLLIGEHGESRGLMSAAIRHQAPIFVGVIGRQNRV